MLLSSAPGVLLKTIPLPFLIVNEEGKITEINSKLLQLLGYELADIIYKPVSVVLPHFFELTKNKGIEVKTQISSVSGSEIHGKVQYESLTGTSNSGIVYFIDVNCAEKNAIANETKFDIVKNRLRLFESFLDSTTEGVHIADQSGRIVYINKTASSIFEHTRSQAKNLPIWELSSVIPSLADWQQYQQVLQTAKDLDFEYSKEDQIDGSLYFYQIKLVVKIVENQLYYIFKTIDISEKIKNNYNLQEKEDQLSILTKHIPGVLFQLIVKENRENYLTYINERIAEIVGFQLSTNNTNWDAKINLHPDDSKQYYTAYHNAINNTKEFKFTGRILLADGTEKWIEISALPSIQNNILYYNGIVLDITAKRQQEINLQIQRQFTDSVLNNIPADIAVFDKHHNYLFVNANGIANEETRNWLIGKNDFDYCEYKKLNPASALKRRDYFNEAILKDKSVDWIDTYENNGAKKFIFRRFYPYKRNGELEYVIGYGIDVTELKSAEELILKNEQRNTLILNSSLDAILMINHTGAITFWNPQSESIFGWKSEEVLGLNIADVIIPSTMKSSHHTGMNRFLATGKSTILNQILELNAVNKNGEEFPVELTVVPIEDDTNSMAFCAFVRDISVRKNKEKQISNQNRKLKVQNKQLEQFTYIASHDLQEPLLTLTSFSELLLEEHSAHLNDEGKLFVEFINKSALRMRALVSGLMDYARIGKREKVEIINCNELIDSVLGDLQAKINQTHAIVQVDALPNFMGYTTYIRLLFQNLISNAIKFHKPGVPPVVHIQFSELKDEWLFSITDQGIGIGKKHQEEIFTIFKRLNHQEQFEGHGIGLSHCKKIVDLHEGDLWVTSQLGEGSTFNFTISKTL
jgi:PAS domain S-box-containing protein